MDISGMMKGLQKKMVDSQKELEEKKKKTTVIGESGGGIVKVTLNGNYEMVGLYISKYFDEEDEEDQLDDDEDNDNIEILSDLIIAAFNQAKKQIDEMNSNSESDMANNLGLPFKMPF